MLIKNSKLYDVLKAIAQIWLPAAGTLYVTLGGVWSFENTQAVLGTIVAIDTFLGVVLGLSSSAYKASDEAHDGSIDLVNNGGTPTYAINLKGDDPDALLQAKDSVTLKVNTGATLPLQAGPPATPGNTNGY